MESYESSRTTDPIETDRPVWKGQSSTRGVHSYLAHVPPCHRAHLRTARRVWRTVVRATHTPLTRVLPSPQPTATRVTISSTWGGGAGVRACADVATDKAKPATAINLSIVVLPSPNVPGRLRAAPAGFRKLIGRHASGRLRV